jgi:peptide/nickel transport system ATP-binding protein
MSSPQDAIVVQHLTKRFHRRGQAEVLAIDDASFTVRSGQSLGLVGESGSGKSTVARCLLGLLRADSGRIEVFGRSITGASHRELRAWRKDFQIVFQEPYESLNPRLRVRQAIMEPLLLHTDMARTARHARVLELLELVALSRELADRHPHQLSGGQQQRVNIARALATEPKVLVLDEPTSSLDVSVRADILRLLLGLQQRLRLTYVLISHDLLTIRSVCERVAVMYLGRLVEVGPTSEVLARPAHPYTEFLLGSELSLDPDEKPKAPPVTGEARPTERPTGCVFVSRCPIKVEVCSQVQPPLQSAGEGHDAACVWVGSDKHLPMT